MPDQNTRDETVTDKYLQSLPKKRMGSGILFRDEADRILIVDPTYKDHWEIPGGVVEADESPRQAAVRETAEELGLQIDAGPLQPICIDYSCATDARPEALMFVFDGGRLSEERIADISLADEELADFQFAPLEEARALLGDILGPRVDRCIDALADGTCRYHEVALEN